MSHYVHPLSILGAFSAYVCITENCNDMQNKEDKKLDKLKDEKLRSMHISASDALIQAAAESGMKIKAEYAEQRIELAIELNNGKQIIIHVNYEDFATGGEKIITIVKALGK